MVNVDDSGYQRHICLMLSHSDGDLEDPTVSHSVSPFQSWLALPRGEVPTIPLCKWCTESLCRNQHRWPHVRSDYDHQLVPKDWWSCVWRQEQCTSQSWQGDRSRTSVLPLSPEATEGPCKLELWASCRQGYGIHWCGSTHQTISCRSPHWTWSKCHLYHQEGELPTTTVDRNRPFIRVDGDIHSDVDDRVMNQQHHPANSVLSIVFSMLMIHHHRVGGIHVYLTFLRRITTNQDRGLERYVCMYVCMYRGGARLLPAL